ncbi:phage portal protein [Ursidibacter sp. B-7004-1]
MKKSQQHKKHKPADNKHFSLIPLREEISISPALDYIGISFNNIHQCYETPINRFALARLPEQNAQHSGILHSRANMISGGYISGGLSRMDMKALALNLIQFGDVGLLKIRNPFGQVVRLVTLSSLYLRKTKTGNYRYIERKNIYDNVENRIIDYSEQDIIFIKLYDPRQQIYGMPDYLGGIQSALLNSDATRFRRRYFSNGAHMGFILYSTDPDMTEEMENEIAEQIKNSKGVGNFRSMFVNIANGHPDGLKIIPVGDTGTKDEFANIKNISAQDILTAHRYPPGLGGIIPSNAGGFGNPMLIRQAYREDEVYPMQNLIADAINNDADIPSHLHIKFEQQKLKNNA